MCSIETPNLFLSTLTDVFTKKLAAVTRYSQHIFFVHLGIILILVLGFTQACLVELGRCTF
jgi:hypothetical protein